MARTKPKARNVQKGTTLLDFYGRISVGDIVFSFNGPPTIPSRLITRQTLFNQERFYLAKINESNYDYLKQKNLESNTSYIDGVNIIDNAVGGEYFGVFRNARLVEIRTDTGSGGIPTIGSFTATEGDGIVVTHKNATTNLTGSVDASNWSLFRAPETGQQAYIHFRSGGSSGSFTPPSLTPATQTGSWELTSFYFETASPISPEDYVSPYISESRILSASSGTAYLPSQTEVNDLVLNVHCSGTGIPVTPTNWTSLSRGTASAPFFDVYYKYITDVDLDDAFTTFRDDDINYTARIANAGTTNFVAGTVTTTITTGSVVSQPTITSMENTQPYQLGFFVGIQKGETSPNLFSWNPRTDALFLDATNEWQLNQQMQNKDAIIPGDTPVSMSISVFEAIEEQVLPPSQMAYPDTFEALGTALSTTYPSVSINFLVKNNQQ
jgi:hypothetical protein